MEVSDFNWQCQKYVRAEIYVVAYVLYFEKLFYVHFYDKII